MKKLLYVTFTIFLLNACGVKDEKRDVFLICEGSVVYSIEVKPRPIEVSSSFYIGKNSVEQEGTKYLICEENKTQIRFADNCKSTQLTEGRIDLITKRVDVDETLKKVTPNRQHYECEIAKNPRY